MKKYLCLLACLTISLAFLAGCSNYGISAERTENNSKETASSQPADTTDWELTSYDTVNNFDGVAMTVKEGTASSTELTVVLENNSDSQCIYGEYFLLEKKIDERWYQVPVTFDGDYGFNSIGYHLASGEVGEWPVNWEWLCGSLAPGEYRIVKDILDFRDTGVYETYYLAAEFIVS